LDPNPLLRAGWDRRPRKGQENQPRNLSVSKILDRFIVFSEKIYHHFAIKLLAKLVIKLSTKLLTELVIKLFTELVTMNRCIMYLMCNVECI